MDQPLRFTSFEDVRAALDRLDPTAAPTGAGRALAHCAQSIELSQTGYPRLKPWLFRATVGRLAKRTFLRRGFMKHDTTAPIAGAPDLPADLPIADAVTRLRAAIDEFGGHRDEPQPHLAYGRCSRAEYERLHAMHIADHWTALGLRGLGRS